MQKGKLLIVIILISIPVFFLSGKGYVIDKETGVRIIWVLEDDMFPKSWRSSRIDAQAEKLSEEEIGRSIEIVRRCLKKYPVSLIKKNLKEVYVVHRLRFFGITAAGTNVDRKVYLVNRGVSEGFTDEFIEKVFHAEFSSILFYTYKKQFDEEAWKNINPPSFHYGKSGVDAIKSNRAQEDFDESLLEDGFLSRYAQSSLENDFNSIAKNIFVGGKKFWNIVETYEKIRKKVKLFITFYHSLDPVFTVDYFKTIGRKTE